ncbi:MAG: cytochrome C oxidase subunit IV family protein [Candidatus Rokuibacteriota bacterium]
MAEHKHPNYMAIFWYLAILTVVEIAVIFLPINKLTIGVLLCALAVTKAALVAMYFMHLRFETRTLGMIAITPLVIATLLVFVLLPDGFAVAKKTDESKKPAAAAPAKH